jgi:hypothetical protein
MFYKQLTKKNMKYYHDEKVARYERRQMTEKKQQRRMRAAKHQERKNERCEEDPWAPESVLMSDDEDFDSDLCLCDLD